MIKRCPTCKRTYSDESISFCLADGTLLSAPLNEESREPPPTEVLPKVPSPPPTQAAIPPIPTIASLPNANRYSPAQTHDRTSRPFVWIVLAVIALGVIAVAIVVVGYISRQTRDDLTAQTKATPESGAVSSDSPTATASPSVPNVMATPSARPTPATMTTLSPSPAPTRSEPTSHQPATVIPAATARTEPGGIYAPSQTDQRAQLTSKPAAGYTDEARVNQVQGTVVLSVVLSADGSVNDIVVEKGLPDGLTERAVAAAKQIKFIPAMKDGHAVSMRTRIEYGFSLY